jgi:predicted ATPase
VRSAISHVATGSRGSPPCAISFILNAICAGNLTEGPDGRLPAEPPVPLPQLGLNRPERQWLLQRLTPLVGVESESSAERRSCSQPGGRFLEGLAANRPSVFVFEDLHWADEALLAFLEHLAEWSEGVPRSRPSRWCTTLSASSSPDS